MKNLDINISSSNDILLKTNIENKNINEQILNTRKEKGDSGNSSKDEINNTSINKEKEKFEKFFDRNSLGSLNNKNKNDNLYIGANNNNSNSLFKENKAMKEPEEISNNNKNFSISVINKNNNQNFLNNKSSKKEENNNYLSSIKIKNEENNSFLSLEKRNSINSETIQSQGIHTKRSKKTKALYLPDTEILKKMFLVTNSDRTDLENSHRAKHLGKEDFLNKYIFKNLIHSNLENEMFLEDDSSVAESIKLEAYAEANFSNMIKKGSNFRTKIKQSEKSFRSNNFVVEGKKSTTKLGIFKNTNSTSKVLNDNFDALKEHNQNKKKLYATYKNRTSIIKKKIYPKKTSEEESMKRSKTHLDEKREINAQNEMHSLGGNKFFPDKKALNINNTFKEKKDLSRIKNEIKNNIFLTYNNSQSFDTTNKNPTVYHEKFRKLVKKGLIYDSLSDDEFLFLGHSRFTFHPNSKVKIAMDFLVLVALLYSMIYLPVRLIYSETASEIFFLIELIFDIVNILDFFLSFFIGFYDFEENYISDKLKIFSNYVRSGFITDLIAGIPINSLSEFNSLLRLDIKEGKSDNVFLNYKHQLSLTYNSNQNDEIGFPLSFLTYKVDNFSKIFKLLRVIKFLKVYAKNSFISFIEREFEIDYEFTSSINRLLFFFLYFLLMSHILTCFFIFLGSLQIPNWIVFQNLQNSSFSDVYVASLYFNHLTIFTIGYGDILSKNTYERLYNIILMVVGIMLYSFTITSISNIIQQQDEKTKVYLKNMEYFNDLAGKYRITRNLSEKIGRYFKYDKNSNKKDKIELLRELPISLRNDMIVGMYKNIINSFIFFKNFDNLDFVIKAIMCFKPVSSIKNENLVKEGDFIEEIIFVKKGVLSLEVKLMISDLNPTNNTQSNFKRDNDAENDKNKKKSKNKNKQNKQILSKMEMVKNGDFQNLKIIELRKNEHFGDVIIFLNERSPLSVRTRSKYAELFLMKKIDLLNLTGEYPEIFEEIYSKSSFNMYQIKTFIRKAKKIYLKKIKNKNVVNRETIKYKLTKAISLFDEEEINFSTVNKKENNNKQNKNQENKRNLIVIKDKEKSASNYSSNNQIIIEPKNAISDEAHQQKMRLLNIKGNKLNLNNNFENNENLDHKDNESFNEIGFINNPNKTNAAEAATSDNIFNIKKISSEHSIIYNEYKNSVYNNFPFIKINDNNSLKLINKNNINNKNNNKKISDNHLSASLINPDLEASGEISPNSFSDGFDKSQNLNSPVFKDNDGLKLFLFNAKNPYYNKLSETINNKSNNINDCDINLNTNANNNNYNNNNLNINSKLSNNQNENKLLKGNKPYCSNLINKNLQKEIDIKDKLISGTLNLLEPEESKQTRKVSSFIKKNYSSQTSLSKEKKKEQKGAKVVEVKDYPFKYIFNIDNRININNAGTLVLNSQENNNLKKLNEATNNDITILNELKKLENEEESDHSKTIIDETLNVYVNPFSSSRERSCYHICGKLKSENYLAAEYKIDYQSEFTITTDYSSSKSKEKNNLYEKNSFAYLQVKNENSILIQREYERHSSLNRSPKIANNPYNIALHSNSKGESIRKNLQSSISPSNKQNMFKNEDNSYFNKSRNAFSNSANQKNNNIIDSRISDALKNSIIQNSGRIENFLKNTISGDSKKPTLKNSLIDNDNNNNLSSYLLKKNTHNAFNVNKNFKSNYLRTGTSLPSRDLKKNNSPINSLFSRNQNRNKTIINKNFNNINSNNFLVNSFNNGNKESLHKSRRKSMILSRIQANNLNETANNLKTGYLGVMERKNSLLFGDFINRRAENTGEKTKQKFNHPKGMKILQKVNNNLKRTTLIINHPEQFYFGLFNDILIKEDKNQIKSYKRNIKKLDKIYSLIKNMN